MRRSIFLSPGKFQGIPVRDAGDSLIVPGFADLHLHAPQYSFRGMGMDLELLDWLNSVTFPEESKYSDQEYARKAYSIFAEDLKKVKPQEPVSSALSTWKQRIFLWSFWKNRTEDLCRKGKYGPQRPGHTAGKKR